MFSLFPAVEKIRKIDRLHGKFTIHSLCRILDVRRSTYYHHYLRSPEKTQFEIGDEKLSPLVREIFYKSKERFGARKNRTILMERGFIISVKHVTRLMQEMNLVSRYGYTTGRQHHENTNIMGAR